MAWPFQLPPAAYCLVLFKMAVVNMHLAVSLMPTGWFCLRATSAVCMLFLAHLINQTISCNFLCTCEQWCLSLFHIAHSFGIHVVTFHSSNLVLVLLCSYQPVWILCSVKPIGTVSVLFSCFEVTTLPFLDVAKDWVEIQASVKVLCCVAFHA